MKLREWISGMRKAVVEEEQQLKELISMFERRYMGAF